MGTSGSLLSGFALDKKVKQISASMQRLEELQAQILKHSAPHQILSREVAPLIDSFKSQQNPEEQRRTAQVLHEYSRQLQADLKRETSTLLGEAIGEMKRVIDSARFTSASPEPISSNFRQAIYRDPFRAGITEFEDISQNGLWGLPAGHLVNPHIAPISWTNPVSGRTFFGKITLNELRRYGIQVAPPKYRHAVDGHVYSEAHGLYLPSYVVDLQL